MKKIKILIANKYFLVNYAIKCILARIKGFEVYGVSEQEVLAEIAAIKPDLLIVEIDMLKSDTESLLCEVRRIDPKLKIIVLLDILNKEKLVELLQCNLDGYMLKNVSREELIDAATSVYRGEKYYSKEIQLLMHERVVEKISAEESENGMGKLSTRESEIYELIVGGMTNKQIAHNLFLSKHTVITHRRNIMKKLNVNNTFQLILAAKRSPVSYGD